MTIFIDKYNLQTWQGLQKLKAGAQCISGSFPFSDSLIKNLTNSLNVGKSKGFESKELL